MTVAALALPAIAAAQDIHFSQFYETSILRNPSMTGVFSGDYKIGVSYRSQWNSISKPYQTGLVSAEARFPISNEVNDYVSVGLLSYYDKAGSIDMQTLTVYPAINYNKSLEDENNSFLSVGFTGGFVQRSFDPAKMTVDNQYQGNHFDPSLPTNENIGTTKLNLWDVGAGITFSSNSSGADNDITYYVGASGYHFTQPKNSYTDMAGINLSMKLVGSAGMSMKVAKDYTMQFHANYTHQGTYSELLLGGMIGWNKMAISSEDLLLSLNFGLFYRMGDAIIPVVKIKYKDLAIGVSYDTNVSKLKAASNWRGGYEITVFKTGLFNDPKFQKSRTICPTASW